MNNTKNDNLTPWIPGQSGNAAGRKPGSKNISTIVRDLLEQDADAGLLENSRIADLTNGKSTSYAQAVVLAMLKKALGGSVQAACWLAEQQERNCASERADNGLFNASRLTVEVIKADKSTLD